jgi:ABC-type glycerol-3-phosphate transport system permease component
MGVSQRRCADEDPLPASARAFRPSDALIAHEEQPMPGSIQFCYLDLGGIYAASTLIALPVIIMVLLVQRQLIRGLTIGGLKG